jgi:gliding motility-associated-like protein
MPTYVGGGSAGNFSLSQVISGGPNLVINPSTGAIDAANSDPGTYIVLNNIPASGGCSAASDTAIITIKPVPTANFSGLQSNYCINAMSTSLTPVVSGGVFSGSGVSGNVFNPSIAGVGSHNITYTVTVNGCTESSTQSTIVNALPVVTANANKDTICVGQSVVLSGGGALSYSWNNGVTNGVAFNPSSTLVYTVTGTDFNNCSNTDTIRVVVHPLPNVTVADASMCQGGSAQLTANGAVNYTWNTGQVGNQITVSPSITSDYWVTGVSSFGCVSTDTAKVFVNPKPVTSITASPSQICSGQSSILTASGTGNSYSWTHNGSTLNQITVSPVNTTTYTVVGYLGACSDTATKTIILLSNPNVLINGSNALDTTICYGASVILNASGGANYSWSNGAQTGNVNITPTSSTTITVVGNLGGCVDSATATINVSAPVNLSVTNATICEGQTGTIVASGAQTYTWSNGFVGNSLSVTLYAPGTYSYSVTGVDANGCVGNGQGSFTVNSKPVIVVRDTSVCAGTPVTISASGALQYSWNTASLNPSITVSPSQTTVYTVIGTNNFNCSDSALVTVTVKTNPVATINGQTTYQTSVCEQTIVSLTAGGAFTYSWSTGSLSTTINPTVTTSTVFTLTATALNGCKDTALAIISTFTPPVIQVNNPSICPGSSAVLVATGGVSYQWSDGTLNDTLIVSPVVNATYTVTGVDANGCIGSATSNITILQTPIISATGATICKGETAVVTVSGNATSYTWNTGYIGANLTVQPLNSVVYTVVASNGSCTAIDTAIVDVKSVATITSTGTAVDAKCGYANGAIINASVQNGVFIYWLDANGNIVSTDLNPANLASGNYTLVAVSLDGCVTTATSSTFIGSLPKANASFTMSDSSGVVPLQVQFINTSTAPSGITIVKNQWFFGDELNTTSTDVDAIFTYYYGDKTDTVKLIITDSNGCTDTAIAYIRLIEPTDSIFVPNVFSPNDDAKNDVFFVKSVLITKLNVEIYNRWGQLIYEWEGTNNGWDGRTAAGQLAPEGVYYYLITGKLKDGSDIPEHFRRGSVTLVR